jgi:thioredoxin-related protein
MYENSVRTSQATDYVSAAKPNRLMLFGEATAVYCEKHKKYKCTLGRMQSFSMLKQVVHTVTTGF